MIVQTKNIHRFWMGREMPEAYRQYGEEWQRLNPSWTVRLWGQEHLELFPQLHAVFASLFARDAGRQGVELCVQIADVMGYAIVERFGGVYVNCDMQPVRPLSALPKVSHAWASYENYEDGRIVNAAIGSPEANDPFWEELLRGLPARYFENPTAEMIDTTGPAYLTDVAQAHQELLTVFPVPTFNPVHWKQIPAGGDATEFMADLPSETIAVHHWGHRKDQRSNRVETGTQVA